MKNHKKNWAGENLKPAIIFVFEKIMDHVTTHNVGIQELFPILGQLCRFQRSRKSLTF